jgi:hypothetical protein
MVGRSRKSGAPRAPAIAEGNGSTSLSFDRIVHTVIVKPKETPMSYSHSIPPNVQIRRDHLLGLIGVVAALAACVTAVVIAFAFDNGTSEAVSSSHATATRVAAAQQGPATFTMTRKQIEGLSTMAQETGHHADPLESMTPAQLAGVGLGTGYQLPSAQSSPTAAAVLASMSPQTRRYTERIMNLTFEQLATGAAGQP